MSVVQRDILTKRLFGNLILVQFIDRNSCIKTNDMSLDMSYKQWMLNATDILESSEFQQILYESIMTNFE